MQVKHVIMVVFALLLVPLFRLQAQIPRTLSYQGVLIDEMGSPKPDSTYTFTFQLYNSESGGTPIWTEIKDLSVEQGLFYNVLGDPTPFADSLRFDRPYWLGIKVGDEPELSPRIPLTSVGYSLYSLRSDTAQYVINTPAPTGPAGGDLTGTYPNPTIADGSVTGAKIQDGTIQRGDVAAIFKAPYADTSDYALAAPPGGSAGGDLTGTYPDPTITDGAVSTTKLAANAVTSAKIADGTITGADINATTDVSVASLTASGTITANTFVGDGSGLTGLPSGGGDGHSLDAVDGAPTDVVFVNDVGNVGIGTTTPGAKLHVDQTTTGDIVDIQATGASVLKVYESGIVAMPKQSSCRVWANASILPKGQWAKIQFANENWDMQNEFDSFVDYCFTANQAGIYSVKVQLVYPGYEDLNRYYGVAIYKNGSVVTKNLILYKSSVGDVPGLAVNDDVNLNTGDTIEIYGYHDRSSDTAVTSDSTQSYVAIHKVL